MLGRDEYIEQRFFYQTFLQRISDGYATQEILQSLKNELLKTTDLPKAVDFLLAELKHSGKMAPAMKRLSHYFTPFATFVVEKAEEEKGRFDFQIALKVLEREAAYRAENPTCQGIFFYEFEVICRNRLGFDVGSEAISCDNIFNDTWKHWINVTLRRQLGIIDLADLIYVRSEFYRTRQELRQGGHRFEEETEEESNETNDSGVPLFGDREGRIAFASRKRDPALFFAALARHLGYPEVPRLKKIQEEENLIPLLKRRIELLENKLQLVEEELRGGIKLERFYAKDQ